MLGSLVFRISMLACGCGLLGVVGCSGGPEPISESDGGEDEGTTTFGTAPPIYENVGVCALPQ